MSKYSWFKYPAHLQPAKASPEVKPKAKAKAKTKAKAKKKEPSALPNIDISGCRYSENVLKEVIKAHGLKAKHKKAVIGAALSQDEDLNRYLNKEELNAGAAIVAAQED